MKSINRFSMILLCSLIALFFFESSVSGQEKIKTNIGDDHNRVTDFNLKDINGNNVKLSAYNGKIILLYFMATWCPDCRSSIPRMKDIYSRYSSKGLVILGIDLLESKEKAAAFSKRYEIPYLTLLDTDGSVSKSYGVYGVPVKALINREGLIICWNCRSLDRLLEEQFEGHTK